MDSEGSTSVDIYYPLRRVLVLALLSMAKRP
jgi:hypothetical protein